MLIEEARYLAGYTERLTTEEMNPIVSIGSGTKHFRENVQPYIQKLVFGPLESRGVKVYHTDIKDDDGNSIVADILSEEGREVITKINPKLIVCANVLEHVREPVRFAKALQSLAEDDARLLVTVPLSYPYHPDPIDNMLRPDIEKLVELFQGLTLEHAVIINCGSFAARLTAQPLKIPKALIRTLLPIWGLKSWRASIEHWRWLTKNYSVAFVSLTAPCWPKNIPEHQSSD